ncbi:STAS domain-containing protein [Hyunsoonleella jejuensis]|uniref:STAS domain-containing protein n=1 Tax=Hyunsoonleella jejuensis TaxID=419940 RepID=A0A1H9CAA8_9FLAO|nr:STAS domain-containing protein [Hyunsoonleella jejuensis]SEP98195.1 STAS domain-containing protein [Hyunsoonleella jejuensis]
MDLRITSCNNFFKLKGILNKNNVAVFQSQFQEAFKNFNSLTISVEGLESVDRHGVNALADLHNQSIKNNIQLSIVGLGCKELYDHFKTTETAA